MMPLDPELLSASPPSFSNSTSATQEPQANGSVVLRNIAVGQESRVLNRPAVSTAPFSRKASERGQHVPPTSSGTLKYSVADRGQQAQVVTTDIEKVRTSDLRPDADEAEAVRKREHEAACKSGYQEGYERGLREGRQTGTTEGRNAAREELEKEIRAAREAVAARLAQIDRLVAAFPAQIRQSLDAAENDMVALCHEVICRILGEQMKTGDGIVEGVRQAVRTAVDSSMVKGAARIHVHPHDVAQLQQDAGLADWLRQKFETNSGVRWVADEQVQLGGCVIHTAEGTLDARLDIQLAALRQFLLQHKNSATTEAATGAGTAAASEKGVHAQPEISI